MRSLFGMFFDSYNLSFYIASIFYVYLSVVDINFKSLYLGVIANFYRLCFDLVYFLTNLLSFSFTESVLLLFLLSETLLTDTY